MTSDVDWVTTKGTEDAKSLGLDPNLLAWDRGPSKLVRRIELPCLRTHRIKQGFKWDPYEFRQTDGVGHDPIWRHRVKWIVRLGFIVKSL